MAMEKEVRKYTEMYRKAMVRNGFADVERRTQAYAERLAKMYASGQYAAHDRYPTIDTVKVYAVIAMCLQLREEGLEKEEIMAFANDVFRTLKRLFGALEKVVDAGPWAWAIAKKWNMADHDSRVKDGSVTFDSFTADEKKISYNIVHCNYVEMFDFYGIREYCKLFCESDTQAYANLTKHIEFIRHSDLSDGDCCHDEILRK